MSPAHRRQVLAGAVVISLGVALLANSFALTGASGATNHQHKGGWGSTTTTTTPTKPKRGPTTTTTTTAAPTTTTSTSTTTTTGVPTTSSTSTSTTTTTTHPTGSYWVPPIGNLEWDWEIGHPLCNGNENQTAAQTAAIIAATVANPSSNPSCAADLGITSGTSPVIAVDGETAPVTNPSVLDIDGFDNTGTDNADESISLSSSGSPVVAELHALGDHVICYVDVGTAENWRPDYSEFPAALLGNNNGWPGERWLDTNPNGPDYATLEKIMTARFEMCKNNGFDAVEPDNLDGSENTSGFNITIAEGDEYAEWLANEIHSLGMSVAQKNFEDQSAVLEPYFDFVIEEQCFQYGDCTDLAPYYESSKAVLEVEYSSGGISLAKFDTACTTGINGQPSADSLGFDSTYFSINLDGSLRVPCR